MITPRRIGKVTALLLFPRELAEYRDDISSFFGKLLSLGEFSAFTSQTLETRRWRAVPGR